ncbi:ribosomal RNA-processing protein 8 [Colossoma macropomum]|uniref:ribosomal RNA-processing protein 8 n=1 Tax=Colossoma macropomum TaxID=42526 RepID=UPI001864F402|nr:ribosomal RNA-processing protein 8 [Colossoma macropomum]XP_036414886.1 ribosomal RNA-processing protein 8 [Colossoma macropomum]
MFAEEEEWADGLPAEEYKPPAGVKSKKSKAVVGKSKAISKRCLRQTLQTLGSVPKWDTIRASDSSDGEVEKATAHVNKKKKKSRKRKKISDAVTEGEQHKEVEASETPVKKRKTKLKPKQQGSSTSHESVRDGNAKGQQTGKEDTTEKKLTRRQWRNKTKSKKRCKNKYRQNPNEVVMVNLNKEKLEQIQASSKEEKKTVDDLSSGKMMLGEKNDFVVPVDTQTLERDKATKIKKKKRKDKESNSLNHSQHVGDESVCEQPSKANAVIQKHTDPHEEDEKQKSVKEDKNSQVRAKKGQVNEVSTKLTEEKQETSKTSKEERKNPTDRSSALRARMEKRLESARFRYINELLYTSTSGEAKRMFKQDPDAIGIYHKGYTEQVKRWPANPVDSIISYIRQKPGSLVVADFGCGDCKIAQSVKNKVHCFDLAPVCDLVTACDMAHVPLADSTVDIAVFCLSLMGTNLGDFLAEANRVLVDGGVLKIAEVASRFDDIRPFVGALSRLGFKLVSKDTENTHFYSFEFIKIQNAPDNVKKIGLQLKPCLYKKR